MAVLGLCPLDLAREVALVDQALRAGLEVLQLDLPGFELIAAR